MTDGSVMSVCLGSYIHYEKGTCSLHHIQTRSQLHYKIVDVKPQFIHIFMKYVVNYVSWQQMLSDPYARPSLPVQKHSGGEVASMRSWVGIPLEAKFSLLILVSFSGLQSWDRQGLFCDRNGQGL